MEFSDTRQTILALLHTRPRFRREMRCAGTSYPEELTVRETDKTNPRAPACITNQRPEGHCQPAPQRLSAAHDATAVALTNIFFHLSRHPLVYAALRREILALGPYQTWTFERLKACKYLQAITNETFRLNPSIGQMNRIALRDTVLPTGGGRDGTSPVFVKKGTIFATSFYALHRLPHLWGPDPGVWRPERWLQKGGEESVKVGHWTFLPFGGGPRICIGMQLALTEVGYAVGRMVERYERVECRDPVWDFVEEWKLTTVSRNGAKVRLMPA